MRQQQRHSPITEHSLARITTWLAALLLWIISGAPLKRDGHRHRHNIPLTKLRRTVQNIILIRAAKMLRAPAPRAFRDFAPSGFRVRRKDVLLRACGGAWLRRRLRTRGSVIAQARHLFAILSNVRVLAAQLATRRRGGLTRLRVLCLIAPSAEACASLAAPALHAINSS